jgi:hypothetical protein
MGAKSQQLQIRVSPEQKLALRRLAEQAGQDLSAYVLARVLPAHRDELGRALRGLAEGGERSFWLAELNELLAALAPSELGEAVEEAPMEGLSPYLRNYVAAMVEHAAHSKGVDPPPWVRAVEPLEEPHFATSLTSLRPHLLRAAPVAFKRRNIFVDSTVGDRV